MIRAEGGDPSSTRPKSSRRPKEKRHKSKKRNDTEGDEDYESYKDTNRETTFRMDDTSMRVKSEKPPRARGSSSRQKRSYE